MWKEAGLEYFSEKRTGAPWGMQDERGFLLKLVTLTAASQQLHGVCALYCAQAMGERAVFEYLVPSLMCLPSLEQCMKLVCLLQPPQWCFVVKQ